jgi:hypothetical protein
LVVEVKTTDAYRIDTTRIAGYRKQLALQGLFSEDASSVLLVVGRQDTGDLEAQIRGSRHAWDVRLISADALLRLMSLKETLDDPGIIGRICEVLIPREYTRLDDIVDLVFSAAEEVKHEDAELEDEDVSERVAQPGVNKPMAFHDACVERVSRRENISLVRRSRSTYSTPDGTGRAVCAVSKTHQHHGPEKYWFAFHPHQDEFLAQATKAFVILGCGGPDSVLAIPHHRVREWLSDLWTTDREGGHRYWHVRLQRDGKRVWLDRRKGKGRLDVSEYVV